MIEPFASAAARRTILEEPIHLRGIDRRARLIATQPHHRCELCVIVPVRDEEERLPAALMALSEQVDLRGRPLDPPAYEVIVLCNNCSDSSAAIARQFAVDRPWFRLHVAEVVLDHDEAHVGVARRMLMDEAADRFQALGKRRVSIRPPERPIFATLDTAPLQPSLTRSLTRCRGTRCLDIFSTSARAWQ